MVESRLLNFYSELYDLINELEKVKIDIREKKEKVEEIEEEIRHLSGKRVTIIRKIYDLHEKNNQSILRPNNWEGDSVWKK